MAFLQFAHKKGEPFFNPYVQVHALDAVLDTENKMLKLTGNLSQSEMQLICGKKIFRDFLHFK